MRFLAVFLMVASCTCVSGQDYDEPAWLKWENAKKLSVTGKPPKLPHVEQSMPLKNIKEGDVGYMDRWHFRIARIQLDPESVVLRCDGIDFLLVEYPIKNLVDGDTVRLCGPVRVLGTATDGISTVRKIRFEPPEIAEEWLERDVVEQEEKAKREKLQSLYQRPIRLKNGKELQASFDKFDGKSVVLVDPKGKTKKFALSQFSAPTKSNFEQIKKLLEEN